MVNQIPGDLVNETGDLHGISFSIIHSLGGTGKSQGLPSVCMTASFCCGFKPFKISDIYFLLSFVLYKILLSFYTSVFWYGNQKFSEQKKDHLNGLFGIRAARSFQ